MNVGKINTVTFNAVSKPQELRPDNVSKRNSQELSNVTPDFGVRTPQKYTKLGVDKTPEGLEIHSYKLANGHRVTIIPMENSPATVKNYVNVGSMNETDDIKGISHFLEHMAFNGTNGENGHLKLERGDSFKKIDTMGGWTNASTNYSLTDYVNSTPLLEKEDLENQIKITASMMEDLALLPSMIEKEKSPVSSEIDMILDNPDTIAVDQTVRTLFNIQSSADELVGGSVAHIQSLTKEKVADYYNKYYTPDNMHLVITGDVKPDEVIKLVSKNFTSQKRSIGKKFETKLEPINHTVRKDFITDKTKSCRVIAGFAGPSTSDVKNSMITDIMSIYLASNEAGLKKDFKRLNASGGIGSEKITTNATDPTILFYGIDCSENDSEEVLKVFFDKISILKAPDEKKLQNIKNHLLTEYHDAMESSMFVNTVAGKSLFDKNLEYLTNFEEILNSITVNDVENYIKNYIDLSKTAITVMHPQTTEDEILKNYTKAQNLSFRGSSRIPVNSDKVEISTLENNYKIGFTTSKNNNMPFILNLKYDLPKNVNPAAILVLDDIFSEGTKNKTEEEFSEFLDNENISVSASVGKNNLEIAGYSEKSQFKTSAETAKELLYNPRITEETFNDAVKRLEDSLKRIDTNAWDLFVENEKDNSNMFVPKSRLIDGLKTLTIDDVRNLHEYIINNSCGTISINIPESDFSKKEQALNTFKNFPKVEPFEYSVKKVYTPNDSVKVLTKDKNVSQAEIKQIYKFKNDTSDKSKAVGNIMNYILSSSDSIGLFNSLREKDHLAYRVNSNIKRIGDEGIVSLTILTSTDNKDTGVQTYENLEKSIIGFNRQIGKLLNSEYTDEDLETAKKVLKADLLNNESVYSRISSLDYSLMYDKAPDYKNDLYKMIDSITREDVDAYAKNVFSGAPIYSIVASKETLEYNKDFLNNLKN